MPCTLSPRAKTCVRFDWLLRYQRYKGSARLEILVILGDSLFFFQETVSVQLPKIPRPGCDLYRAHIIALCGDLSYARGYFLGRRLRPRHLCGKRRNYIFCHF
jgi:hypothetical protein